MGNPDEKNKPITERMDLNPYATKSSQSKELGDKTFAEQMSDDIQSGKVKPGENNGKVTTTNDSVDVDVNELVNQAYDDPIKSLGEKLKGIDEELKTAKEQDETYKRRARSMKMIAGISDGLAAMANMIGVAGVNGAHASNQQLVGASPALAERFERARLERKADIKTISDRLEQYKAQEDALKLRKGETLADFTMKKAEIDANAAAASAKSQMDWLKFIMGEEGDRQDLLAKLASEEKIAEGRNKAQRDAAYIRTHGNNGGSKGDGADFKFRVGDKRVSIKGASDSEVAAIFSLLPLEVRQKYGKIASGTSGIMGDRENPIREEMEAAIGENWNNEDFIAAYAEFAETADDSDPHSNYE